MAKKNVKIDEEVYDFFLKRAEEQRRSVSDQISLDLADTMVRLNGDAEE